MRRPRHGDEGVTLPGSSGDAETSAVADSASAMAAAAAANEGAAHAPRPDAPAVLLVHGFGAFGEQWRGQVRALTRAGYQVPRPALLSRWRHPFCAERSTPNCSILVLPLAALQALSAFRGSRCS